MPKKGNHHHTKPGREIVPKWNENSPAEIELKKLVNEGILIKDGMPPPKLPKQKVLFSSCTYLELFVWH